MQVFEFVLLIIALVSVVKLIETALRQGYFRRQEPKVDTDLVARLHEVEERVRVLERIVTDERFDLKQQFKDLSS
jgi:hypothetical protein